MSCYKLPPDYLQYYSSDFDPYRNLVLITYNDVPYGYFPLDEVLPVYISQFWRMLLSIESITDD